MSDSWLLILLLVPVALCTIILWHSNRALLQESQSLKKQLEEAVDRLQKSSANDQEKTQFLARMSHDIRTHLNVMLGFTQLQKNQIPLDAPAELKRNNEEVLAAGWKLLKYIGEAVDPVSRERAAESSSHKITPSHLAEVKYSPRNGASKRSIRIVHIEKERACIELIRAIADLVPELTVFTSPTVDEGLKIAQYRKPDFFLLDADSDDFDIAGAAQTLRDAKHFAQTPLVAITTDLQTPEKQRLVRAGFSNFLHKPIKVDHLINLVREIEDQRTATKEGVDERAASGSI